MLATLLTQYNLDGSNVAQPTPLVIAQRSGGRQPFSMVELYLDFCTLTAGIAPCTATQTGDAKCYNTYSTCNDKPNFSKVSAVFRFCSANGGKVPSGLDAIPCLKSISMTPPEVKGGQGLGLRASVTVSFQDFPHSDIRSDPYFAERSYIPINQGTYFGKLKARNPYYNGRIMRVYSGYLEDDGSFDINKFQRRTYVIEQWDGIDANGVTKITAKDVLKLASDDRAVCPKPSFGKLSLDITATDTTITLTPINIYQEYPASGYVRIGQEILAYTNNNNNTFTVDRAKKGTVAATHKQSDTVQLCKEYTPSTVQNIVYDLLVNFAGVSSGYINLTEWTLEQTSYLPRLYSTLLATPTGVSKILNELAEQVGFFLFWDEVDEKIRFQTIRANAPNETVHELTADYHLLADTLNTEDITDERTNEVWVYYGVVDYAKNLTDDSNYSNLYVSSNVEDQSVLQNNDVRIKKVVSRWITDKIAANELATRYLHKLQQAPIQATFALDAKDANIKLCDFVQVTSKQYQAVDGSPLSLLLQVVKRTEKLTGTTWAFTARQFAFGSLVFKSRQVSIDGSYTDELFDLNLKTAHDRRYDASSLKAGDIVDIIIESGVLVSASSTSLYAVTQPNTWPAGVVVNLIVKGAIAGRGGNGGRGGRAYTNQPSTLAEGVLFYYGGDMHNPSSVVHGKNGGNAIKVEYSLSILNNGLISVGGGGGGASGGAVSFAPAGVLALCQSGSGGGGGWPYGQGGLQGQSILDDSILADHNEEYKTSGGGILLRTRNYIGFNGQSATNIITVSTGGAARDYYYPSAYPPFGVETEAAGNGSVPPIGIFSTGGGGGNASGYVNNIYAGDGGNGGADGDYAVNGNSFITWINTGTIYGNII